jgi:DNA-binding CsgD family transcriptional regulator
MAEAQVALQATTGRSVSEIGIQLNVSPNTVKTHLSNIFAKTRVRGRRELIGLIAALGSVRCLPEAPPLATSQSSLRAALWNIDATKRKPARTR